MSFGLYNWFAKKEDEEYEEYEKCKANKEIDAVEARVMVRMAIDEQIKSGIARANEAIYDAAERGRTCCYTTALIIHLLMKLQMLLKRI